jgi:DNA-binding IclR family transcriptional regulator
VRMKDKAVTFNSAVPARGRKPQEGREPTGIIALETGLALLKILIERGGGVSLTDLSTASALQPNKLHRYLVSLTRFGMIRQQDNTGLYELGPEAFRMGVAALGQYDRLGLAQSAVDRIADATGHATHLYVWTPMGPTVVRSAPGRTVVPLIFRLGTALPVCGSATGLVFSAYLPEAVVQPLIEKEKLAAAKDGVGFDEAYYDAERDVIRSCDVYWSERPVLIGKAALAPIFDARGNLECVITCVVPRGHCDEETKRNVIETLRHFRKEVEQGLI